MFPLGFASIPVVVVIRLDLFAIAERMEKEKKIVLLIEC